MPEKKKGVGAALAGSFVAVALVVGAGGAIYLGSVRDTVMNTGESIVAELGYTLTGGSVEVLEAGEGTGRRATILVTPSEGYALARFQVASLDLRVGVESHPARQIVGPPDLPTEECFELVYELPAVPAEDAPSDGVLRIEIEAKATKGLFGLRRVQSDCSQLFWVRADHLEHRAP